MMGEADLGGHRILVVEDDYFLARDTVRAVQGAGAHVLGPCPNEEAAYREVDRGAPTGAVIDINLGTGPSFDLADRLKQRGIPFIFITGYDASTIPHDFADVVRLQKPAERMRIVSALARTLGTAV